MNLRRSLKEAFGGGQNYLMGIANEVINYDGYLEPITKTKGWVSPFEEVDLEEIEAFASRYNIWPRRENDVRKFWESGEPEKNQMTGDETYYIMVVKHTDGSDLSFSEFKEINDLLAQEDGEGWL